MNILEAIILGIVQGIAEFLPISSSAHLELIPWIFGWQNPSLSFDAALHLGTALAVGGYFFKEIIQLFGRQKVILFWIALANIPAVIVGYFGEHQLESFFHESPNGIPFIALGLIFFAFVILIVDRTFSSDREPESLRLRHYLYLGCAQALALIPGVSRSGITVTAGRSLRLNRENATRISFVLGMPITFGASLYSVLKVVSTPNATEPLSVLFIGTITSFVVGLLSMKWLLGYLKNHPLAIFSWYRIVFGSIVLAIWFFR